jgi:hypothetical protein
LCSQGFTFKILFVECLIIVIYFASSFIGFTNLVINIQSVFIYKTTLGSSGFVISILIGGFTRVEGLANGSLILTQMLHSNYQVVQFWC